MKPELIRSGRLTRTLRTLSGASALILASLAGAAHAQDYQPHAGTIVLRLGVAGVLFNGNGKFTFGGQPLPGANLSVSNNVTAAFEGEYYVRPDLSLALGGGVPPTTNADGKGSLAPLGRLGSVRYGPAVGLVKYHFNQFGRFQPYVGAGATYMFVFGENGAAIPNLHVDESWGAVIEGGAEYMLTPRWGIYASAQHLFLRTHGNGSVEGIPITAKAALDPTILQSGVSYRF